MIAQIKVPEPEAYAEYIKLAVPTIMQYGGEFIVRAGRSASYEGTPPGDRTAVIRFPFYAAADDWYQSAEYAEAKALRMSLSTSVQTIEEGV